MSLEQVVTVSFSVWLCWTAEIQEIAQSPCLRELTSEHSGDKDSPPLLEVVSFCLVQVR